MPRKREVVKIDEKEYTIKELTVEQIIDITSGSVFFSSMLKGQDNGKQKDGEDKEKENSLIDEIKLVKNDIQRVMEFTCDFKIEDLRKLTPSEIRTLYDAFMRVNSDFLSILEKVGAVELLTSIKDIVLNLFSRTLVTLSNQAM
jgi:hypothetical protein